MDKRYHTRASTRAGTDIDPPPLDSPSRILTFGSIAAGSVPVSPSLASAMGSITSVMRPRDASGTVFLAPVAKSPSKDETSVSAAQHEPESWTTADGRTSRTHRERDLSPSKYIINSAKETSKSESTVARATNDLSGEQLDVLARHYQAFAAQLHAASDRKRASEAAQSHETDSSSEEAVIKRGIQLTPQEEYDSKEEYVSRVPPLRRATVEEVEDETDLFSSSPAVVHGQDSSRKKGKGADPRNWGDVSFLENFSEREMKAQHNALQNFAEIHRVVGHERVTTPHSVLVDISPPRSPQPKVKKTKAPKSSGNSPDDNQASMLKLAAPKTELPQVQRTEPETRINTSDRDPVSKTEREHMSGQTHLSNMERLKLLYERISEVEARQRETNARNVREIEDLKSSTTPKLRGVTPGRLAAGSFLDKALRGANKTGQGPAPSDSSDSSSSSSSDSSSSSSDESRELRRRPSSPRMSAKRTCAGISLPTV
ncbi:hypothetical protein B0H19DRAFT_1366592 [Mycena capillaripes]|nr:hypothetical protein B0H19DRAFT_1366592 [Mycena capillaripes]